jgi:hypothetical protein
MVQGRLRSVEDLPMGVDLEVVAAQQGMSVGSKLEGAIETASQFMDESQISRTIGEFMTTGVRPDFSRVHNRHVAFLESQLAPERREIAIAHGHATVRMLQLSEARAAIAEAFQPAEEISEAPLLAQVA